MTRNFQYASPFVLLHPGDHFARGYIRVHTPVAAASKHGYIGYRTSSAYLSDEELKSLSPDVVIFHQIYNDSHILNLRRYRDALPHAFFIYELDDLIIDIPDSNANKKGFPPDLRQRLELVFPMIDRVVCSTEFLASRMKSEFKGIKEIKVIPNYLLRELAEGIQKYQQIKIKAPHEKPRIGWAGGATHGGDLVHLTEVVNRTKEKYQWVFFGFVPEGVSRDGIEFHPPVEYVRYDGANKVASMEYYQVLADLDLDVAVAPLELNDFNRAKSNLKLLEYGVCGYPVIATEITPYATLPCFRVGNMAQKWIEAIDKVVSDSELRNKLATDLKEKVLSSYMMEDHLKEIVSSWTPSHKGTLFVPTETNETEGYVVVGEHPSLQSYATFEEARKEHPTKSIIYIRPGTLSVNIPENLPSDTTVSFVSNDGFYPEKGRFSQIDPFYGSIYSELLRDSQAYCSIPLPVGPVIYFPNSLLSKVGIPHEKDFSNIEVAIYEWGCLPGLPRESHKLCLTHFQIAGSSSPFEDQDVRIVESRYPGALVQASRIIDGKEINEWRENLDIKFYSTYGLIPSHENKSYQDWCEYFDSPEFFKENEVAPTFPTKISILMPVYYPELEFLKRAVESVVRQYHTNWELCLFMDGEVEERIEDYLNEQVQKFEGKIKVRQSETLLNNISLSMNQCLYMATGEWTIFLDQDDELAPHALLELAKTIAVHPEMVFAYSDEDKLDKDGKRTEPYFKPTFDYYLFLGQNYPIHLSAYKTQVLKDIGGFDPEMNGAQDYDITFRYLETTVGYPFDLSDRSKIIHIPRILYHWRQTRHSTSQDNAVKPYARENNKKAVLKHLVRMEQTALVAPHPIAPIYNQVRFVVPNEIQPLISIIIPTKDKIDFLKICLSSILKRTSYPNYEILVIDTGSKESKTRKFYETSAEMRDAHVRLLRYNFSFNWSAVNNFGVQEAKGDYLVFLNNDTEVVESRWLDEMLGFALRPDVGVVGAKLLFADQTIQHCGVSAWGGVAGHTHKHLPVSQKGYYGLAVLSHESTAVTGACMMVSRSWFEEIGRFDLDFKIAFNDVAFCRESFRKGKKSVVCMDAVLYHHESITRGPINKDKESYQVHQQEAELLADLYSEGDPYWNPNLRMYDLTYAQMSWPPQPFFWQKGFEERESILVINGMDTIFKKVLQKGKRCVSMGALDFSLPFLDPQLPNMRPFDIREGVARFNDIVSKFNVEEIWFYHLGRADITLYRFLERTGIPIRIVNSMLTDTFLCPRGTLINDKGELCGEGERYIRCEDCVEGGSFPGLYGYVNVEYFKNTGSHFMKGVASLTDFTI